MWGNFFCEIYTKNIDLLSNFLYYYSARKNIEERGICYVFEAEKSVLLSENFSTPNCAVAICGSQFNKYQVDLLMRFAHPREIILCLDNEEKEGSTEYFEKRRG